MRLFTYPRILQTNLLPMIGVLLCAYFSYHAISGERSLIRLLSLEQSISQNVAIKDKVIQERETLESKVIAMRPGSIDRDLLEERSREILGYKRPDEIVIFNEFRN